MHCWLSSQTYRQSLAVEGGRHKHPHMSASPSRSPSSSPNHDSPKRRKLSITEESPLGFNGSPSFRNRPSHPNTPPRLTISEKLSGSPAVVENTALSNRSAKLKPCSSKHGHPSTLSTASDGSPSKHGGLREESPEDVEHGRNTIGLPLNDDAVSDASDIDSADASTFPITEDETFNFDMGEFLTPLSRNTVEDKEQDETQRPLEQDETQRALEQDENHQAFGRGETQRALEQLSGSNWLGHTAIWMILSCVNAGNRARVVEPVSPPRTAEGWRDWGQTNSFTVPKMCEVVLIPLHVAPRQHWVLVIMDMLRRQATLVDSTRDDEEDANVFEACGQALLASIGIKDGDSWQLRKCQDAPQQKGPDDCGIYMLVNCLRAMQFSNLNCQDVDAGLWRFLFKSALDAGVSKERTDVIIPRAPSSADLGNEVEQYEASGRHLKKIRSFERAAEETTRTLALACQRAMAIPTLAQLKEDAKWRKCALSQLGSGIAHSEDDTLRNSLEKAIRDREEEIAEMSKAIITLEQQKSILQRVFGLASKVHQDARRSLGEAESAQHKRRTELQRMRDEARAVAQRIEKAFETKSQTD
ncbi:uncharacterized protein J3D65DRAFT_310765 [Phyllosticta citribraziliensis]|uniref:Ubiquitin-like protease family profile domain-containing protein n=1 Tax=Phyllosticta citribraziliensis TaxID=989973 RepID=A0ABR1LZN4_9PEZI